MLDLLWQKSDRLYMHRFYEILLKIHSFFVTLKKHGETVADCQRTRLGGFAGLAALARFSGRAAGETRAVGKFPDADKASVERGETRREALFLLLRQALPVLCRSHVLQPLEYVIKET